MALFTEIDKRFTTFWASVTYLTYIVSVIFSTTMLLLLLKLYILLICWVKQYQRNWIRASDGTRLETKAIQYLIIKVKDLNHHAIFPNLPSSCTHALFLPYPKKTQKTKKQCYNIVCIDLSQLIFILMYLYLKGNYHKWNINII